MPPTLPGQRMIYQKSIQNYRPEVDGLRAIAVLAVLMFHVGFEFLPGGFAGVDIFFVISGYLITRIIDDDVRKNQFSLARFYERRARRILPALYVTISLTMIAAAFVVRAAQTPEFYSTTITVLLFVSNFYFATHSGYFDTASNMQPFLHTWSLSVEEQFYIFYPLFAIFALQLKGRTLLLIYLGVLVASFFAFSFSQEIKPTVGFYMLPTRAWELLLGALVAIEKSRLGNRLAGLPVSVQQAMSATGALLILLAITQYRTTIPFAVFLLAPTLGATLLISVEGRTLVNRLLSLRPVVWVGLVSYSAYLFHLPIFVLFRIHFVRAPSGAEKALLLLLTVVLAFACWRLIENPFRTKQTIKTRMAIPALACTFAALSISSVHLGWGQQALSPLQRQLIGLKTEYDHPNDLCLDFFFKLDGKSLPLDRCGLNNLESEGVILLGDSHAGYFSIALREALKNKGLQMAQFTASHCVPVQGIATLVKQSNDCVLVFDLVHKWLETLPRNKTIILISRWAMNFEATLFNNREGGDEGAAFAATYTVGGMPEKMSPKSNKERKEELARLYREGVQIYLDMGFRVILIYPVPEMGWNVPNLLSSQARNGSNPLLKKYSASTSFLVFAERNAGVHAALDAIPNQALLSRVKPAQIFCEETIGGRCFAHFGESVLYADDDHLSKAGGAIIAAEVLNALDSSTPP